MNSSRLVQVIDLLGWDSRFLGLVCAVTSCTLTEYHQSHVTCANLTVVRSFPSQLLKSTRLPIAQSVGLSFPRGIFLDPLLSLLPHLFFLF
ncbi:hypothetical protein LX32DRAFT_643219 [Colletotrichum zoysiae]|uniref:Uncharacterized protein n=1 Tax=Colletotrichum zoysiae TaxID=1216348 RepID=A0AAD9H9U7_9PEZI|nr:hypothetical protein LX32DRAFT_643219 [Colletotrichum zoysiae]